MKRQVIVVGAGPGGSAAAFYLAKAGVDVLFVDKAIWPREKPCGDSYLPSLYPIFEDMGIMEEMAANVSCDAKVMRLIDHKEEMFEFDVQPWMIIPRRFGDDIIRRAAVRAGADFMEDFDVTDLIMKKGVVKGIKGYYQNRPIEMEADAVVIANGSHSMISRKLGGFKEAKQLINYAFRGYFRGVEGLTPGAIEEYYFPDSFEHPTHNSLCMLWCCPMYEARDGMASVGLTVPERALDEADMTLEQMFEHWATKTKWGKIRMKNAELLDNFKCMRLPSSEILQKSIAPGAIIIGDAANAAEPAFDYGIPSAMIGGQIAAGVLKKCLDKGDVSEEALSEYQTLAEEAINPGLAGNTIFMRNLLGKRDVMDEYLQWAKNLPEYPHCYFDQTAMRYMTEVMGLQLVASDKKISQ